MNDTDKIRLANLEAVADMRRSEMLAVYKPLAASVAKVINDAIAASGSTKYALRTDNYGLIRDFEYMTIDGKDDNDRLVSIDLYYRHDTWEDRRAGKPRTLAFSTCGLGTVKAGDTRGMAYCLLLGYLAAHLKEMEDAINAIPEWAAYDNAYKIWCISRSDAEALAKQIKDEEMNEARARVEERLVSDTEIATTYDIKWDCEKCVIVATGVHTMTIEKVTKKLVFFKGHFRQYKKYDVCAALVKGIDAGGWSFASDIDMTQFPRPYNH